MTFAQNITGRNSQLNYNYVYGGGGDSNVDSVNDLYSTLNLGDMHSNGYTGSTSGVLPGGTPYAASVYSELNQMYSINGTLSNFTGITASATTRVTTSSSGAGTALMNSSNQGNSLTFFFTVGSASVDYTLTGNVTVPPSEAGFATHVTLQKFDGITWQMVYTSIFLPGSQGTVNSSGTLLSGDYRMVSEVALNSFGNEDWIGSYNYDLQVVPEPVTMFAIAPALMLLARRKRKNA